MDKAIVHAKKAGFKNENPIQGLNKDSESSKEDCLSERLVMEVKPEDLFLSNIKKSRISDFWTQKLFLQQISSINKRIPKPIMSPEEKYLRHCLELIHISALRANSCDFPPKINFLPDRSVAINSSMDPIIGSITQSTSIRNILNSPLILQLGSSCEDINEENTTRLEVTDPLSSSQGLRKERVVLEDQSFVSLSSTNSTLSNPYSSPSSSSSSSFSSAYSQGMLHCSWNDGFPQYVFSVEDQREVYITDLSKVESLGEKGMDYIYTFHSKTGKRGNDLVGKMRVSTSFTSCRNGKAIMETQFVLCAVSDYTEEDLQISNQALKKNKGLSKKVAGIFRGSHSYRQRTSSKFDGSFSVQENLSESSQDGDVLSQSSLFSPNLELAAIVVRDHVYGCRKEVEIGGWGLKFLEKRQKNASLMAESVSCEGCGDDNGCHSTSMEVVVPSGFHGGVRTRNGGGPSSLVERWRSGGSCDCGGWDIGCPITVFKARPKNNDFLCDTGVFGHTNSFDLFTQGSKQSQPVIKVVNIHDGLYYIHYLSTLSALQSLSISVAIIHSHSPTLRPKNI